LTYCRPQCTVQRTSQTLFLRGVCAECAFIRVCHTMRTIRALLVTQYAQCALFVAQDALCWSHNTRRVGATWACIMQDRGRMHFVCGITSSCHHIIMAFRTTQRVSSHHVITSSWHFVPHKESPRNIEKEQNMPPRTRGWPPSSNSTGTHAQRLAHKCASMHACTRARVHACTPARMHAY